MSALLEQPPYGTRDAAAFLTEITGLTEYHRTHCPEYARVLQGWPRSEAGDAGTGAAGIQDLPFMHVSAFKHLRFQTQDGQIKHEKVLNSSATSSGVASQITLDRASSALQAASSRAILADFIGAGKRPLIVLDSKSALIQRGAVSARIAAGLALRPFATRLYFGLDGQGPDARVLWEKLEEALHESDSLLVYGFTWVLWQLWAGQDMPPGIAARLAQIAVTYVHSGGWKKLEAQRVAPADFNARLTALSGPGSRVVDYYGLVEQNGVIYPECAHGWRHVPVWADVLGRNSHDLSVVFDQPAQLQLMNLTPQGAPYHSVLTEDLGLVSETPCDCGRSGRRFRLLGRLPKAEVRGCANV